jgi:hypothetical protein
MLSPNSNIISVITGNYPLLDSFPGAAVAFSTRLLRTLYTGSAIRVRRSSDNAEQDIGFDINGNLNESALLSFVGANNGFVTTWYDQSTNARHLYQTNNVNQPMIVSSGTIIKIGGKPWIQFVVGGNNRLETNSFNYFATNQSSFVVAAMNGSSNSFARIITQSGALSNDYDSGGYIPFIRNGATQNICSFMGGVQASVPILYGTRFLGTSIFADGFINNKINNSSNFSTGFVSVNAQKYAVGNITSTTAGTGALDGFVQEVITYNFNQTSNAGIIQNNINNYYVIY